MTTLFGWGPMFGCRGPSPFVIKSEIQLQMFGIAFDRAIADLDSVTKHKAPYVKDDGMIVEDSAFIRRYFEQKLGVDLDAGLTTEQRATAWAFERMFEDHLSPIMAQERWLEGDNFARGPAMFFQAVPEPMRQQIIDDAIEGMRAGYHASGLGRHSRAERIALASRDIDAASQLLGDKAYLLSEKPTALDAAAFGVLSACTAPIFDTELRDLVAKHSNLAAYLQRMEDRFFAEDLWPVMMAETEAA